MGNEKIDLAKLVDEGFTRGYAAGLADGEQELDAKVKQALREVGTFLEAHVSKCAGTWTHTMSEIIHSLKNLGRLP
uniref:Uncharacterized protein n=1 Tax=viral metagenome TaxID=1070528 RepID=A0A6M3KV37_9ZZZZ